MIIDRVEACRLRSNIFTIYRRVDLRMNLLSPSYIVEDDTQKLAV